MEMLYGEMSFENSFLNHILSMVRHIFFNLHDLRSMHNCPSTYVKNLDLFSEMQE